MLHVPRSEPARLSERSVVDATSDFLPTTPLDPRYLKWLTTKSERLPERPPSYLAARRWAGPRLSA